MAQRRVLPYGAWSSPITLDMAVGASTSLREPRVVGDAIYWTEGRPEEGGRQVIVRWTERTGAADVIPAPFNARTMIHEYGGGWYAVDPADETVYFCNESDGRVYRQAREGMPQAVTPDGPWRYGDLELDFARKRIVCIREDHSGLANAVAQDGQRIAEPRNELVAIDIASGAATVLSTGYDFYSSPRVAGDRLTWLSWRHPNMPWDGSELWVAQIDAGSKLANEQLVAGGKDESVVQPQWAPDGSLVFVSDRSGWWNLYRLPVDSTEAVALAPMKAEFAGPQWVFGMRWYDIADDGSIVAVARRGGKDSLWLIPAAGDPERIDLPDQRIASVQVGAHRVVYQAASWDQPAAIVMLDLDSGTRHAVCASFTLGVDEAHLSRPEQIEFPTTDGDTAYALYYPPTNPDFAAPGGERPPLIVEIHGGPTSSVGGGLSMGYNLFTSRGFAVVDVDYRGSNGFGREYMRKLYGNWGVSDVDDVVAAARFLAERGDVDPDRMAIRGGSAGGYTVLAALTIHELFAAGASHYGVGDLEALARFTHKFESHYLDQLVAPYPQAIETYRERSPIYHVDRLSRPLIVLQGVDDMVVPIAQAEQIVDALRRQQIPHAYLAFEGEGHGFRRAENIRRALEAELSFYAQVFGFTLADDFEPVHVEFLAERLAAHA